MLKAPRIWPEWGSVFWLFLGLSVFVFTLTVCFAILSGRVESFSAGSEGVSLKYLTVDDALEIVRREEDAWVVMDGLVVRNLELERRVVELEGNPVFKWVAGLDKSGVKGGGEVVVESEMSEMVRERIRASRESVERFEAIKVDGRVGRMVQEQVRQEQQQQGR